jgi:hypothetical protein
MWKRQSVDRDSRFGMDCHISKGKGKGKGRAISVTGHGGP